jgi:hypothetical protein
MTQTVHALPDGRKVCLGRIRPLFSFDHGNFRYLIFDDGRKGMRVRKSVRLDAHYDRTKDVAPPPVTTNWMAACVAAIAEMYGNDTAGDCVIAAVLKLFGAWTGNESGTVALSNTDEALSSYQTICGPGDNGCEISAVLDYLKATGIPLTGVIHKIDNYVALDNTNQNMVQVALEVFGPGHNLGINLPGSWMQAATASGFVWDVASDPSIGGHSIPIIDCNEQGVIIATWAMWGTITWAALADTNICEECWTPLGVDWYSKNNLAPNGINAATLAADLTLLGAGTIPPFGPTPPVPPNGPPPVPPNGPWSGILTFANGLLTSVGSSLTQAKPKPKGISPELWALIEAILAYLGYPLPPLASRKGPCGH